MKTHPAGAFSNTKLTDARFFFFSFRCDTLNSRFCRRPTGEVSQFFNALALFFLSLLFPCRCYNSNNRFCVSSTSGLDNRLYCTRALFPVVAALLTVAFACARPVTTEMIVLFPSCRRKDGQWPPLRQYYFGVPHFCRGDHWSPVCDDCRGLKTDERCSPLRWIGNRNHRKRRNKRKSRGQY